jgi:hypothetical protein
VWQGGRKLGGLDAANPTFDVPIGIPLPGVPGAEKLPIIGDLLANGQQVTDAVTKGLRKLDLGVLRIGVAQLDERSLAMTDPFEGFQLGATARLLDLQVLPTKALGLPNLPSALVQVSLGEQVARAYAPTGGVVCRPSDQPQAPPTPEPQGKTPPGLAYTTLAYQTIPMFWTGTAMLLVGVVLVAAVPGTLRAPRAFAPAGGAKPTGPPPTDPEPPAGETERPADGTDAGPTDELGSDAAPGAETQSAAEVAADAKTEPSAATESGAESGSGADVERGLDGEADAAPDVAAADAEPGSGGDVVGEAELRSDAETAEAGAEETKPTAGTERSHEGEADAGTSETKLSVDTEPRLGSEAGTGGTEPSQDGQVGTGEAGPTAEAESGSDAEAEPSPEDAPSVDGKPEAVEGTGEAEERTDD